MPFITNHNHWILLYILVVVSLLWKGGKKGRICVLLLFIIIALSDQISSSLIKEAVGRIRPCHVFSDINLLVPCGGGKSFPSSHAVNNFSAALVLSYFYREYKWIFFSIATLMAFSRVYVGVHYPFDVICGAIIGLLISFSIILVYKWFSKKVKFFQVLPPQ
jgi:undecaprenyl-diphosphatase